MVSAAMSTRQDQLVGSACAGWGRHQPVNLGTSTPPQRPSADTFDEDAGTKLCSEQNTYGPDIKRKSPSLSSTLEDPLQVWSSIRLISLFHPLPPCPAGENKPLKQFLVVPTGLIKSTKCFIFYTCFSLYKLFYM